MGVLPACGEPALVCADIERHVERSPYVFGNVMESPQDAAAENRNKDRYV